MQEKSCDIVFEGGGVKGLGLVGAIDAIVDAGFTVKRIAGTSAGALVGSLLAAGMTQADILSFMHTVDYKKFRDNTFWSNFGIIGQGASLLFEKGIYKGDYFRNWLRTELEKLGVRTFSDLKINEPWAKALPPNQRYKLVVVVSDISRGQLVRLPWDYHYYGLNPDEQFVVDAVRASISIPFFYKPARLKRKFLVDGGVLSNFPIDSFDSSPDWPTFGVKLSAKEDISRAIHKVTNIINMGFALMDTMMSAHDQMHLDDPSTIARTIFVDTLDIKATNFDITPHNRKYSIITATRPHRTFFKTGITMTTENNSATQQNNRFDHFDWHM